MKYFWQKISARIRYSWKWGGVHLVISGFLVGCVALLVYLDWYQAPWASMLEVSRILCVLAFVDLLCGPVLTMVLVSPEKPKVALIADLALVGVIQFGCFFYGSYAIFSARPVVVIFEVDRLVLVTANQLPADFSVSSSKQRQGAHLAGLPLFDVREPESTKEYLESLDLSLQGLPRALRPGWWQSFNGESRSELVAKLKPLDGLAAKDVQYQLEIDKIVRKQPVKSELFNIP